MTQRAASGGSSEGTYLGSLDGSPPVRITSTFGKIALLPSGWLLIWNRAPQVLVAQRLDVDKAALTGAPVTLAEGFDGLVSASARGLLAYWTGNAASGQRQLQWRSRIGADLGSIGPPDKTYGRPRISPDGRRVAVDRIRNDGQDIWILEGERTSRLTLDGAGNVNPVWSPDGGEIVFAKALSNAAGLYRKRADGAGKEQLLLKRIGTFAPDALSPDGRYLSFVYIGDSTQMDIGMLPMAEGSKAWTFLGTPFFEGAVDFSPDGKWVAYQSDESGRPEVYVRPFSPPSEDPAAGRSGRWQVSTAGGSYPRWSPNGKELFFLNPALEMMAAPITFTGSAVVPGTAVRLFQTRIGGDGRAVAAPPYDLARDGRFLINALLDTKLTETPPIILIQNWDPDATRR